MKIKLERMTSALFERWLEENCSNKGKSKSEKCKDCIFRFIDCGSNGEDIWVFHKELYSHIFLEQEVEIKNTENLRETKGELKIHIPTSDEMFNLQILMARYACQLTEMVSDIQYKFEVDHQFLHETLQSAIDVAKYLYEIRWEKEK